MRRDIQKDRRKVKIEIEREKDSEEINRKTKDSEDRNRKKEGHWIEKERRNEKM